jgi:hypothetical protein
MANEKGMGVVTQNSVGAAAKDAATKAQGDVLENNNPSLNQKAVLTKRPPRVPMSEIRQRLQVAPMPGWRLYWFKDDNVPAAVDAYYEFVKRGEVALNPNGIGTDSSQSGNTDLGTNVSIIAGQNAAGQPVRLNLMKLKMEYYEEDQRAIEKRNSTILQAIFGDEAKVFDKDGSIKDKDATSYVKTALFNRPTRKAKIGKRAT